MKNIQKKKKKQIFLIEFPPNEIYLQNREFLKKIIFEDFFNLKKKKYYNMIIICNSEISKIYQIKNFLDFFFLKKIKEIKLNPITKKNMKKLGEKVFEKNKIEKKYKKFFLEKLKNIKNDLNQFWIFFEDFFFEIKKKIFKKTKFLNLIKNEKKSDLEKIAFFKKVLYNKRLEKKIKLKNLTGKEKSRFYKNSEFLLKINNIYFSPKKNIKNLKISFFEILKIIFSNLLKYFEKIENLENFYFFLKKILNLEKNKKFFFREKNYDILSNLVICCYMITNENVSKKFHDFSNENFFLKKFSENFKKIEKKNNKDCFEYKCEKNDLWLVRGIFYELEKNDVDLGNGVDYGDLGNGGNFGNGVNFGDFEKNGKIEKKKNFGNLKNFENSINGINFGNRANFGDLANFDINNINFENEEDFQISQFIKNFDFCEKSEKLENPFFDGNWEKSGKKNFSEFSKNENLIEFKKKENLTEFKKNEKIEKSENFVKKKKFGNFYFKKKEKKNFEKKEKMTNKKISDILDNGLNENNIMDFFTQDQLDHYQKLVESEN